jgi:hypothetical protein
VGAGCCLLLVSASGCGPPANPQKLREEVLQADPSFAGVLEKRDEQANRISLLEREFDLKRTQAEGRIAQLRKEVKAARAQVDQKIQHSKTLLRPDLDRLQLALSMASDERQAKRAQRASLGRSISRLKKALQAGDTADRTSREREVTAFLQEAQRLDREIQALNEHLRLLKIKILLLRV